RRRRCPSCLPPGCRSARCAIRRRPAARPAGAAPRSGDTDHLIEAPRRPDELLAYVELHIEQGGILEANKTDIGVVEGIVGIRWWDVTVTGFANHAGTTPMDQRRDALLSAARLVLAVNEVAK